MVQRAEQGPPGLATCAPTPTTKACAARAPVSGALRRGSMQTAISQSAGSCRNLQNQGFTDP
eukprot:2260483-Pyramimonas_sp.AAC.1